MAQWVNDPAYLCGGAGMILGLARWVKDLVLLWLWHRSQLWLRFNPCLRNFHMLQGWLKKKKKTGEIDHVDYTNLSTSVYIFHENLKKRRRGIPVGALWKRIRLGTMRLQVRPWPRSVG